jgi:nucleoside-triphosphatase
MRNVMLITGPPGIGKTTILCKTGEDLSSRGYKIGGMTSQELREDGNRVGFQIENYSSGSKGWLAHIHQPVGPRIGKYRVNLHNLDSIGVAAITQALIDADIVVIDEIGPMELFSGNFRNAVRKAVNSCKPLLGTIHFRSHRQLISQLGAGESSEIIEVTVSNRDRLPSELVDKVLKFMRIRTA